MPKSDIHPTYYKDAKLTCACGATFKMGATRKEIQVEICSNCHPFYTGEKKLIDTAGRVEKFQARRKKATDEPKNKKKKKAIRARKKAAKAKDAKSTS